MGVFDFLDIRHPMWGTGRSADMDAEKAKKAEEMELSPIPSGPPPGSHRPQSRKWEQERLGRFLTAQKELAPTLTTGPFRNTGPCNYMKRDGVHVQVTGQSLHDRIFREEDRYLHAQQESQMDGGDALER